MGPTTQQPTLVLGGTGKTGRRIVQRLQAAGRGVRRLMLLSGRGEEGARRGEQALQQSGADWTIVRSAFMAQNFDESFFLEPLRAGEVAFPAGQDLAEPFIDADDIADVAVAALTGDGHVGQLYEVTGPRLLTWADAVAEIAAAAGRPTRYVPVSLEGYASLLTENQVPAEVVKMLTEVFSEIAGVLDGRNAYLSDGVQRALGRPPRDFADFVRDAAATGIWSGSAAA